MLELLVVVFVCFECILLVSGFLDCCNSGSLECLKTHHDEAEVTRSRIALLNKMFTMFTYETDNILDYALHSFAVNQVYAEYHHHDLILTTSRNGFEFEHRDQRWNKVKIMETFMNEFRDRTGKNGDEDRYLVWLDSDLIFLNFEFDLSKLVAQYPLADLIVSADVEPLNGMVNTGCMIVRVSNWSRLFFQDWWEATDRVNGMDQHVFDLLYKRRKQSEMVSPSTNAIHSERIDNKIAILPTYALNSHIPASRHQQPHHSVLHLAGESAVVRAHIFRKAFEEVCRVHAVSLQRDGIALNTAYLAPQLGLSRQVLQTIDYTAVLYTAVHNVWHDMLLCSNIPPLPSDERIVSSASSDSYSANAGRTHNCGSKHVLQFQARLRDAMQSRDLATTSTDTAVFLWNLYRKALRWSVQAHTHLSANYLHTTSASPTTLYSPQTHLELLQNSLDAAFELLSVEKEPLVVQSTLTGATKVLQVISEQFVRPEDSASYAPILYYQFKYFDFLAIYYHSLRLPGKELESLEQARTLWEEMASFRFYGAGNSVSDPYRELAGVLARMAQVECREGVHYSDTDNSRFERGLALVRRSVKLIATKWLPSGIFNRIQQYTESITGDPGDALCDSDAATVAGWPVLLSAEQSKKVPIKVLHILSHNYALAAKCARQMAEAICSDVTVDANSALFGQCADANVASLYRKYNHVTAQLCRTLSAMGETCSVNSHAEFANIQDASVGETPNRAVRSDELTVRESTDAELEGTIRDTRTVKLKRKKKNV